MLCYLGILSSRSLKYSQNESEQTDPYVDRENDLNGFKVNLL